MNASAPLCRYALAELREEPWRNGGGVTRTIAAAADRRASIADIARDGAFSIFDGMARHAVLLDGAGLCLCAPDAAPLHFDAAGALHQFPGERPVSAQLGDGGPARLFNLMTRRGLVHAHIDVLRDRAFASTPGSTWIAHVIAGRWRDDGDAALDAGAGIVIAPHAPRCALRPETPGAMLIAARIDAA